MLLRRFPLLNDLPIWAIQAQSIAKTTIQVSYVSCFISHLIVLLTLNVSVGSSSRDGEKK